MAKNPRGSRKHVLDWVSSPNFRSELNSLLKPAPVNVPEGSTWMPQGQSDSKEARLETFGPRVLPNAIDWGVLRTWWLKHEAGANTPNWDFASTCEIEGRKGILLLEAKAHVREPSRAGKELDDKASAKSIENHDQISKAISEAETALRLLFPKAALSHAAHYQLANRIAFTWKLASLGLPTALVYIGFLGDTGIADVGEPFVDEAHWRREFKTHATPLLPTAAWETRIVAGGTPFWLLVRAKQVLSPSARKSAA